MSLLIGALAAALVLAIERIRAAPIEWRAPQGLSGWVELLDVVCGRFAFWHGLGGLLLLWLPLLLLTLGITALLAFNPVSLLLWTALVIWYCLGPTNLGRQLGEYHAAVQDGHDRNAEHIAQQLLIQPLPRRPAERAKAMIQALLWQDKTRQFNLLFWAVLLGPVGAVSYRLVTQLVQQPLAETGLNEAAKRVQALLDWLPIHLACSSYAVLGSFEHVQQEWQDWRAAKRQSWAVDNRKLVVSAGCAAIRLDERWVRQRPVSHADAWQHVFAAWQLCWRSTIMMLVVAGLFGLLIVLI